MSANGDSLTKADLIAALTGMRDELRGDIRAAKDEVRGEVSEIRGGMHELSGVVHDLRAEVHHLKDDLIEMVRDVETKLLSEFHRYAKGQQFRLHSLDRPPSV
jgi:predicted  nucleic acid-binding Zn-ribbon protein